MREHLSRAARSATGKTLLALLGVLALLGGTAAGIALAENNPPTPTITAKPSNPTNQTSASFSFTDSQSGVTFQCSLDNAAFAACTTPKTYAGPLAQGSHTFQVKAVSGSKQSTPAASTWTIDTTAPTVTLTAKPSDPSDTPSPSFSFAASEPGAAFQCKLDAAAFAACSSPKALSGLAFGSHTFQVKATDAAGNAGVATSYTWTIVPPAPTITAKPANPTNQTSASFSFTDTASGVIFQCSLDGSAFAACTSPKSYPGPLTEASHTFQVKAVSGAQESAPSSYTWTVDTTPPTMNVSFPTSGSLYNASAWNAGCSGGPGICGSATDPSGVASGLVSVRQNATGKYWNGSSFSATSEQFNLATQTGQSGTTSYGRYPLALPPDGSYTAHVRATDTAGNTTSPGSQVVVNFTIDTVPPATPVYTQTPPNPSSTATSTFAWTDSSPDVAYSLCSRENGPFLSCSTPTTYAVQTTSNNDHQFAVVAVDLAGNVSQPATYKWKVAAGSPQNFTITGSVGGLYIGVAKPVPLTLTNPNNVPIYVTALTVSISTDSTQSGCGSGANIQITQSNASTGSPITVPANGSVTLATAPQAPQIKLIDLPTVNQNICKSKSWALSYSGSAHS